ncbi:MAG TPA: hypothetical protein VGQ83_28545 [Polyangia bacterium]|jgi:hypothetical protein
MSAHHLAHVSLALVAAVSLAACGSLKRLAAELTRDAAPRATEAPTAEAAADADAAAAAAARAERCRTIVSRMTAGLLAREDELWLAKDGALARRISDRRLYGADLKLSRNALPCGGPESLAALATAAAASTAAWENVTIGTDVAPDLTAELASRPKPALGPAPAAVLAQAAESKAKAVVRGGGKSLDDFGPAYDLCVLAERLLGKPTTSCDRVAGRVRALEQKEKSAGEKR